MKQSKSLKNLLIYKYNFTIAVYSVNKEISDYNKYNYNQMYL